MPAVIFAIIFAPVVAHGQSLGRPEYTAGTKLVLVPVTVTDRNGALIGGLSRDAFTISEDGARQAIRSFAEEESPVSVGVVLDTSGSMKELLPVARESLRQFDALSNPADEAFLATVSTRPHVWSGFGGDFAEVFADAAFEPANGSTALLDTIWVSLDQLRSARNARKALVVISDGMDNHSRHSRRELLERASESDAQIFTILLNDPPRYVKGAGLVEIQHGMQLMGELASRTGGIGFTVRGVNDIENAVSGVSKALRDQYSIGYIPGDPERNGKWRHIQVRVDRAGLKAHSRSGYRLD